MAYKRYDLRGTFRNGNSSVYGEQLSSRKVKAITQYRTPVINYPTLDELSDIRVVTHLWTLGDRFYKLSYRYYDTVDYWWIIPWFNQTPLETDLELGDTINIPFPIDDLITYFR